MNPWRYHIKKELTFRMSNLGPSKPPLNVWSLVWGFHMAHGMLYWVNFPKLVKPLLGTDLRIDHFGILITFSSLSGQTLASYTTLGETKSTICDESPFYYPRYIRTLQEVCALVQRSQKRTVLFRVLVSFVTLSIYPCKHVGLDGDIGRRRGECIIEQIFYWMG